MDVAAMMLFSKSRIIHNRTWLQLWNFKWGRLTSSRENGSNEKHHGARQHHKNHIAVPTLLVSSQASLLHRYLEMSDLLKLTSEEKFAASFTTGFYFFNLFL